MSATTLHGIGEVLAMPTQQELVCGILDAHGAEG
jgi:hypothetical protein